MTPDEWIKLAPDAVTAVAALLGGAGAVMGVSTWQKQLRGQHAYDVSRKTYVALLQVRETLDALRSPYQLPDEVWAAVKEGDAKNPGEEEREINVSFYIYRQRWNAVVIPMQTLEVLVLEAEIVVSSSIRTAFAELRHLVATVKVAMDHYLTRLHKDETTPLTELDMKQYEILHMRGRDDQVVKDLEAVIAKFSAILRPHLGGSKAAKNTLAVP